MADVVNVNAAWRRQETTLKSGAVSSKNYRIDFQADELLVNLDAKEINAAFSAGMLDLLKQQIQGVTEIASDATIKRRQASRRNTDSASYRRRYAGGKIGETPPSTSIRKFNDSGRLANNLAINVRRRSGGESVATLNVPGNRFDPRTGGNIDNIIADAKRLIPLLRGDTSGTREVDDLVRTLADGAVATSAAQLAAKRRQLRSIQLQIGRRLLGV